MTTISISLGSRNSDQIQISVVDITDAVEIKNAVMDLLNNHSLSVDAVCLVNAGQFIILKV